MRIKLAPERKDEIVRSVINWFSNEFDEEISPFRAEALVDFMLKQIGPSQYNQAIIPTALNIDPLHQSDFFRQGWSARRRGTGTISRVIRCCREKAPGPSGGAYRPIWRAFCACKIHGIELRTIYRPYEPI